MNDHSSAPPVRVGLVGVGYIADYHFNAVRSVPGGSVVAVCDVAKGRAERFASAHGIAGAYSSVEEMMRAEQLDAVHVLTPPHLHEEPTRIVLEHGADALVEKPLCHDSGATGRLRELAAHRGRALGCSHNFLFLPAYDRLVADLRSGRLGAIDQIDIVWNKPLGLLKGGPFGAWMLQQPTNILFEVAPHSFAHLAHLVGMPDELAVHPFDRVELPRGLSFWRRWEILAWKGAAQARLRLSFVDGYPEHYIHIRGTQAVARCDFENNTYVCLDHTPHLLDVDRFLTVASTSRDAVVQAGGTLAGFVLTKMGMSKNGGPFQHSITRIAQTFHEGRGSVLDERVDAAIGEAAVIIGERVAAKADLPANTAPTRAAAKAGATTGPTAKVLVIGGTGFIGRALVRRLREAGHGVRVLVRDPAGCPPELQQPGIDVRRGDFTDLSSVAAAMDGIEVVYHLARGNGNTWPEFLKYDVEPTAALAKLCAEHEVKRFLYTSSIALYYAGKGAGTITEDTAPAKVGDPYARSKVENEANLLALHRERGLPLVLLRPGIVLGRGGPPLHWGIAAWPYPSVARLYGDGNNKLPIVLVDDCADAMVKAMTAPGIEGRSYNLVGPPVLTANDYLDALEQRAGIRLRRIPTTSRTYFTEALAKWALKKVGRDPHARRPTLADAEGRTFAATLDGGRAERELGWAPTRDRDAIIRDGVIVPTEEWFELGHDAGA
ncbi:MAG: NAD-dependent epimerase/dehydratase family protein [Deltaproteobacteria bacterium]|nr:NAD-dependent epimerase/dehydratase family protein [Deltaproteobacteria bacterium]MBK8719305.1 NAD-dependent epimerase/dehydratase family protein [Deltaproteobacteria bacterium]MBP7290001.1 NAD-dependent epimerase/dehydratase family protein [Nannocystaceae bacterium]